MLKRGVACVVFRYGTGGLVQYSWRSLTATAQLEHENLKNGVAGVSLVMRDCSRAMIDRDVELRPDGGIGRLR